MSILSKIPENPFAKWALCDRTRMVAWIEVVRKVELCEDFATGARKAKPYIRNFASTSLQALRGRAELTARRPYLPGLCDRLVGEKLMPADRLNLNPE